MTRSRTSGEERVDALRARRPRNRFVRACFLAAALAMIGSLLALGGDLAALGSERRIANLTRFLSELRPFPLRGVPFRWGGLIDWAGGLFAARGAEAAAKTLAISIVAIGLAGAFSIVLSLPAARNLSSAEVFLPEGEPDAWLRLGLRAVGALVRGLLAVLRSIPEYVIAFGLLAILGANAWPAVLALAVHNCGILGRLGAETIENLDPGSARGLRAIGATRTQIAAFDLLPSALPRMLLYFFYRFETCVREAMVLGMLGIASLGFFIEDARVRGQYDNLLFYVGLGVAIVLAGDLISAAARRLVRNGGRS